VPAAERYRPRPHDEDQQLIHFLGRKVAESDRRFEAIDHRCDRGEATRGEHDERFRELLDHFDQIYRRLERLEQEYQAILQGLRRIENLLSDERGRREVLERALEELKRQAAALQARIQELEQRVRG